MAKTGNDMELALRIRADIDQAVGALQKLENGLTGIGKAGQEATDGLANVGADAGKVAAVGNAADKAADSLQREAETAEQAADRIQKMVAASLEYQRALEQQLAASRATAEAADRGAAASTEQAAAVQKAVEAAYASQAVTTSQIQSISELHNRVEQGARSFEDLAYTEQLLDRAVQAGLVSSEEQLEIFKKLEKQEKSLQTEKERMLATRAKEERQATSTLRAYDPASAALRTLAEDERKLREAVDAGVISREKATKALASIATQRASWEKYAEGVDTTTKRMNNLALSAREVRSSLASVSTNLLKGNLDQAGSSLLNLGTRGATGLSGVNLLLGGIVATLGLFAVAAWKADQEMQALERSLISSGNIAGTHAGQLAEIRNELGATTGKYGDAQTAVMALAKSGQVSADMLQTAAGAAMNLAELTGDSIESTTQKIIALAKAPSAQLEELNRQYNFLTLEVYEHVRSLEEQGRQTDATRAAVESFAQVHDQRVQEARDRAGYLEQAWRGVKSAVLGAWQAIKDIGRDDVDARLKRAQEDLVEFERIQNSWGFRGDHERARAAAAATRERIAQLQAEKQALEDKAAADARDQEVQNKGIDAAKALQAQLDAGAPKAEKYAKAVEALKKQFNDLRAAAALGDNPDHPLLTDVMFMADGSIKGGAYDKALAALKEQHKERTPGGGRTPKSDADRAAEAARRDLENMQKQVFMLGELTDGQTRASEAARIRYEIEHGAYKGLSAAMQAELIDHAQLLDGDRQRIEMGKEMVTVREQLARLAGRGPEMELAKTTEELKKLEQQLLNIGKVDDAADVAKLLNLTTASAQLTGLRKTYDDTMGQIALEQQRIQVELQAGLLTEADAQQRIVNLYRDKLGTLRELVPQMRAAAEALGDPAALAAVEQIELKLREMAATTDLLQQNVRNNLQAGFKDAFMSLVDGSAGLEEMITGFFRNLAMGMADFVAEQWSQALAQRITGMLFDQGMEAGTEVAGAAATQASAAALSTAAAGVTAGAGAITTSAGVLSTSSTGLMTGAAAISAAATQLQAAATTMLAANAAGGMGGFADGGFTGWGGKYQPAGIVHKGEGVARQEVMRQPGALPFFLDFNRRGMQAVMDWRGYADGGHVGFPSIGAMPSFLPATPASASGPQNRMRVYVLNDENELAKRLSQHPAFEKAVVAISSANGNAIQAEW